LPVPDIRSYKLSEFFSSTYQVPRYQRNYSWGELEVTELFNDLLDFHRGSEDFYLLGETIAASIPNGDADYELIDGQQRATTLVILLSIVYRNLRQKGADPLELLETTNSIFKGLGNLRLQMSGDASNVVLAYLDGAEVVNLDKDTPSKENVVAAFETLTLLLAEAFPQDDKQILLNFSKDLLGKVFLGRLTLDSVDQATTFFERVNNRGLRLTNADLLKNRLLQNIVSEQEYDWAATTWREAEQTLMNKGKLGTLEYLLRQMRQAELRVKVQEKELYEKMKDLVRDEEGCLKLVDAISSKYKTLAKLLEGQSPNGTKDSQAEETDFFGFTQGLGVKLAASNLDATPFDTFNRRLTARAILSLLASERSQSFEKMVPIWSNEMSDLEHNASTEDIDSAFNFDRAQIQELFDVAHQRYLSLIYNGTPGQIKRIRFILAKANFEVLGDNPDDPFTMKGFLTTAKLGKRGATPGFDIDHIYAQGGGNNSDQIQKIGNLTLLHSSDNRGAGAGVPAEKATVYGQSKALLTRALTRQIAQTPRTERKISPYRVASVDGDVDWIEEEFIARAEMYWGVLKAALLRDLNVTLEADA